MIAVFMIVSLLCGIEESLCLQAVYEPSSQKFIINTPTNTASKFWIGGAATSATVSLHLCLYIPVQGFIEWYRMPRSDGPMCDLLYPYLTASTTSQLPAVVFQDP